MKLFIGISELKFRVEILDFKVHHMKEDSEVLSGLLILSNIYF